MKKKVQKKNIADKVSQIVDIPSHLIAGTPLISIVDNDIVHIENYGNIIEFREDMLSFRSKSGVATIKGANFEITSFTINNLDLKGIFTSVELDYRRETQ